MSEFDDINTNPSQSIAGINQEIRNASGNSELLVAQEKKREAWRRIVDKNPGLEEEIRTRLTRSLEKAKHDPRKATSELITSAIDLEHDVRAGNLELQLETGEMATVKDIIRTEERALRDTTQELVAETFDPHRQFDNILAMMSGHVSHDRMNYFKRHQVTDIMGVAEKARSYEHRLAVANQAWNIARVNAGLNIK